VATRFKRVLKQLRWESLVAVLASTTGCLGPDLMKPAGTKAASGHVVMLPGVEGSGWQYARTVRGLRDAGLDQEVEIIPWGSPPLSSLHNLVDLPANLERAKKIARRLTNLRREHPDAPLTLVGVSGGGGLALLTLEALPDDIQLDRVILVAAAISKDYDLSKAQPHITDKLVNFYSKRDAMVGLGTSVCGTIDRKLVRSAGHCGFTDETGELAERDWLVQIAWKSSWWEYGHYGGHFGYFSKRWARHVLAIWIDPTLAFHD